MKYAKIVILSALLLAGIYYTILSVLVPSPVSSEYWVGQMITVKRNLVASYHGKRKLIIGGGSSSLFGIDAREASRMLGMPVINLGLHASLRLERMLYEVGYGTETGDIIVLQLEPSLYGCAPEFNDWRVQSIVAWDTWERDRMSSLKYLQFLTSISPTEAVEILVAKSQERTHSPKIANRLVACDSLETLRRFKTRAIPDTFEYSAFNLDDYGSMMATSGKQYQGLTSSPLRPRSVCPEALTSITGFVARMRARGIQVYFTNPPYIKSDSWSLSEIDAVDQEFRESLQPAGGMIDTRRSQLFDRKFFFNTNLHLNSEGRMIRTQMFVDSIRKFIPRRDSGTRDGR